MKITANNLNFAISAPAPNPVFQTANHDNTHAAPCKMSNYSSILFKNHFAGESAISFGTIRQNNSLGLAEDTGFFRDLPTLNGAVNLLKTNFPNGAQILDYACSDGEEAISIYALLGRDAKKFDINAYDTSPFMIARAKAHKYCVKGEYWDKFLLKDYFSQNKPERRAARAFSRLMEDLSGDGRENMSTRQRCRNEECYGSEKYFKFKPKYWDKIAYSEGDIQDIDKHFYEKPIGAVFFRNAFYHVFRPQAEKSRQDGEFQGYREMSCDEIKEKTAEIIEKIDSVLEPGGIFVMGDIAHEHLITANDDAENDEIASFSELYPDVYFPKGRFSPDTPVFKTSPIVKALEKKGYKPVHWAKCIIEEGFRKEDSVIIDVPTVWQKPKP